MSQNNPSTNGSEVQIKSQISSNSDNSLDNKSIISEISEVERRLKALKKLQFEKLKLDGEVEKLVLQFIQTKFQDKYESIYQKRAQIVSGSHRPTDEECDFKEIEDNYSDPYSEESMEDQKVVEGIHDFWLESLKLFPLIRNWISEEDESVLQHLKDIRLVYNENPSKFIFEFVFGRNEYFTNEVLRKEYEIGFGPEPNQGWNTDPFYPIKRKGCPIDWKESTRLGKMRKTLQKCLNDSDYFSFFNFFSPPEETKESNEEISEQLIEDWQIALTLYNNLVPNAVLYYTGDLIEDDFSVVSESSSTVDPYDGDGEDN